MPKSLPKEVRYLKLAINTDAFPQTKIPDWNGQKNQWYQKI